MSKLIRIEDKYNICLPMIYRDFYNLCSLSVPPNLVGTDFLNNYSYAYFTEGAAGLLEDDGVDSFLNADDFIFMMHQGYMFWYFKADGDPDPVVYGYYEGKLKPNNHGHFSTFIKSIIS